MRSMTGYGDAAGENDRFRVRVSLKGVNHRFLDLSLRLDEPGRSSEGALRELLASRLRRGRIEARVGIHTLVAEEPKVALQTEALDAVKATMEEAGLSAESLSFGDLVRLPGVFELRFERAEWTEEDQDLLLRTADEALEQLVMARCEEGARLAEALLDRLDQLDSTVASVSDVRAEVESKLREQLRGRLVELLGDAELDPGRLAQEAAYLAERSDVREELDRLRAHLEQFRSIVEGAGASGKRLDFLTQELLREVNTLGSKSRHVAMTRLVLDAKMLCEQLREQLQNVE